MIRRRRLLGAVTVGTSLSVAGCTDDFGGAGDSENGADDAKNDGSGQVDDSGGDDAGNDGADDDSREGVVTIGVFEQELGDEGPVPGDGVEGASVSIDGDGRETDESGEAVYEGLDGGEYELAVEADGYEDVREDVYVPSSGTYTREVIVEEA